MNASVLINLFVPDHINDLSKNFGLASNDKFSSLFDGWDIGKDICNKVEDSTLDKVAEHAE